VAYFSFGIFDGSLANTNYCLGNEFLSYPIKNMGKEPSSSVEKDLTKAMISCLEKFSSFLGNVGIQSDMIGKSLVGNPYSPNHPPIFFFLLPFELFF
jgi:hypothetical protein